MIGDRVLQVEPSLMQAGTRVHLYPPIAAHCTPASDISPLARTNKKKV